MSCLFRRSFMAAMALTLIAPVVVEASGPRGTRRPPTRMETEVETEARLVGVGAQLSARGEAEHEVETKTILATGVSTTKSELEVSVKRLALANGTAVSFQLNGTEVGTGAVRYARASLRLSSFRGDTVPDVLEGDTLTVVAADGTVLLTGTFGPAETEVEYKR